MNLVTTIFTALLGISMMVALILAIAWHDFDRPRHALTWAIVFALLSFVWGLELAAHGGLLGRRSTALVEIVLGGLAAAFNTIGFRQRIHRDPQTGLLLGAGLLPALVLLAVGRKLPTVLLAAPFDLLNTIMLMLAAATLVGRRRSEQVAQRVVFGGLLLLATLSFAMFVARVGWASVGEPEAAAHLGKAVLMVLPAAVTGIGLFAIFLLAADLADQTRRLAATDTLTGLLNRRGFEEAAAILLRGAVAGGRKVTLALVDIDHFKSVNDSFGHQMGDWVIARFGRLLAAQTRNRDLLARVGGEEFAILMDETDIAAAAPAAEAIREEIGNTAFDLADGRRVTASFGLAELAPDASHLDSLLSRADRALYRAKAAGRDRVMLFDRERDAET